MDTLLTATRLDNRRFNRLVLLLLGAGFVALLLAGAAMVVLMLRNQDQSRWVRHTYEVERHVAAIQLMLARIPDIRGAQALDLAQQHLEKEVEEVRKLTVDNPEQQRNVATLLRHARLMDQMRTSQWVHGGVNMSQESAALERHALKMLEIERGLLAERTRVQRDGAVRLYWVLGVAALLLVCVGGGSFLVIRRYTASLTEARDQLQGLNAGLEEAVAVRTVDLQRANDEIQRFAYIVSHDLRSPLVNVMGFTAEVEASVKPLTAFLEEVEANAPDISTKEARLAILEDIPESVGFIRSSTQKMDRLINAILRLSREGRRTIGVERINLADVAHNVVDNLRHRIDELGVEVIVAPSMPHIMSDRLAVDQILGNLVENAVKYLQPGRPGLIEINGQVQRGRAMVNVRDNGRGIEARDHDRVFDLFRRSGEQDQPGEGIGLAHVRALAYRLGGTITVASEIGVGSTFTLNLPVEFSGDKGSGEKGVEQ